ncbi:flagellar basal body protein [Xylophilus rhododendri]|uniref:Flagellar basal body rod protein FlgB n=1 Tax=Xylophilus rhododendri TaxID=2697032 RepID=A0A857J7X3_9BURK|nr:flagellar basal body protein [Xylophilus rhododendri]QHI99169.1 flagellar basal body protein [Xylophilus rhododendri]
MNEAIASLDTRLAVLALDAAELRQQAIAANIANAGTPGYRPLAVSFEDQLGNGLQAGRDTGAADLAGIAPRLVPALPAGIAGLAGAVPVQLDREAAALAQNAVHYQALVKALSHHYALLSTAVGDGRK